MSANTLVTNIIIIFVSRITAKMSDFLSSPNFASNQQLRNTSLFLETESNEDGLRHLLLFCAVPSYFFESHSKVAYRLHIHPKPTTGTEHTIKAKSTLVLRFDGSITVPSNWLRKFPSRKLVGIRFQIYIKDRSLQKSHITTRVIMINKGYFSGTISIATDSLPSKFVLQIINLLLE